MLPHSSLAERMLLREDQPEGHAEVWRYLLENQMGYPRKAYIHPFKRPSKPDQPKVLSVAEFIVTESQETGVPSVLAIRYCDRWLQCEVPIFGYADSAKRIANLLFRFRRRGWLTVFRYGNARDFRVVCQQFITQFVALGYRIQPLNAGSDLIALKVMKGKHVWYLIDYERLIGIDPDEIQSIYHYGKGAKCACIKCLESALDALYTIQDYLISHFQVGLRITIGATAIRAAAICMPENVWKWKPHPLLVTMCRRGGAYRGGISVGRGYRGPAWMVDTNRLYTWAITRELPLRASISPSNNDGILRTGIYVVSVFGPAAFPIYVPVWGGTSTGFTIQYWRGDVCISVLSSYEIAAIRALGYRVRIGGGFRFFQTFNLADYVGKILASTLEYGRNSLIGRVTKPLGNSVYGKFAENPERSDAVFSADRPGPDFFPFLDSNGDEIDNLWERKSVKYNSHQHVDIGTTITAIGRAHMYDAIGAIIASGGIIGASCTDSIITNINPESILDYDASEPGKWRLEQYDPDGITIGKNTWAIGGRIALAGAQGATRATIERIAKGDIVVLHGIKKAPLKPGGPIAANYTFSVAPNANSCDSALIRT